MSNNNQVCFSSKTTIITDKFNDISISPEVNSGQNDKFSSEDDAKVDKMWEKLVLYYLSRLKGLCDWRSHSYSSGRRSSQYKSKSIFKCPSEILEEELVKQVTEEALKETKRGNTNNLTDIGTYMAAGYQVGKQQAAKIVIRSLKFGLLTGILKKEGSVFKLRPKYKSKLKRPNGKVKSRKSCECKKNKQKRVKFSKKSGKAKNTAHQCCCSKSDIEDGNLCSPQNSRRKRSCASLPRSSTSSLHSSRDSVKPGPPPAKRKRSRKNIKKPVIPRPHGKKRGRSQTRSPTPSKSRSNSRGNNRYKPRKLNSDRKYQTPKPRRRGSVLSSMSSVISLCTACTNKRKRSTSSNSNKDVKKSKH